jgi:hypothetical protein
VLPGIGEGLRVARVEGEVDGVECLARRGVHGLR